MTKKIARKSKHPSPKPRASRVGSVNSSALQDLEWAYNRLDHLMTVAEEGEWDADGIAGPMETIEAVHSYLPELRARYGFKKAWPNGRFVKPNVPCQPRAEKE